MKKWLWLLPLLPGLLWAGLSQLDLSQARLKVVQVYGERAGKRLDSWQALMAENQGRPEAMQMELVNNFFNQFHFIDDDKLWHQNDYWATPLEFIGANGGDCEDFAIAKFFTLLSMGVPEQKMRITYVKALSVNQYHMVLAFYPSANAVPFILDNLVPDIRRADQRPDLLPIYSFNGQQLWLSKEKGRGQLVGGSSRLKRWQDLQSRFGINHLNKPQLTLE
ncbi:MAG: transglutaminase-like cysteine peptidase [Pseudomonadota bacterium]|uniref:Putative transglutaminase-like cysteine proteinase n=1 Tax=Gallaecimonas pentaromativorans TaxID=584787 RepID=A0A3N1P6Z7_9GAMM|nr:transglutaminase-like cysteine peptidase [Gallaecimonas pentaromativorans]MED5526334.1 transglutaminase-like cysteine peptidase [Pseudomonadota bacterium]ROQ22510.1 putative transglutaminase-like cysteine proteinase [Gallaecimonas pentaromativorans]